jgi:hypothetical protein
MKKLLTLGLFLVLSSMHVNAKISPIVRQIVTCMTEDAMSTFTKKVWVQDLNESAVFEEMNKNGVVCRIQKMIFIPVRVVKTFADEHYTYQILEIKTSVIFAPIGNTGISQLFPIEEKRYAMFYFPIKGADI